MPPDLEPPAPDGHTFSPMLREQQREVDSMYSEVPALAAKGKDEFERLFAAGHERWEAGEKHPALENLARPM